MLWERFGNKKKDQMRKKGETEKKKKGQKKKSENVSQKIFVPFFLLPLLGEFFKKLRNSVGKKRKNLLFFSSSILLDIKKGELKK